MNNKVSIVAYQRFIVFVKPFFINKTTTFYLCVCMCNLFIIRLLIADLNSKPLYFCYLLKEAVLNVDTFVSQSFRK